MDEYNQFRPKVNDSEEKTYKINLVGGIQISDNIKLEARKIDGKINVYVYINKENGIYKNKFRIIINDE